MSPGRTILLLLLASFLAPAAIAAPALQFDANRIAVSGVTPKGSVYMYGLSREAKGTYSDVITREELLVDSDGDGVVVWTLDRDLPLRSIWLAVDMASGAPAVATTPGFSATRVELAELNLKQDFGSGFTRLAFNGELVEFVVVRPRTGAWRGVAAHRGLGDEGDDADRPTIAIDKFEAKAGTRAAAPQALRRGDVVLMLDPSRLTYGVTTVGGAQ